jgi:catalase
MQLWINRPRTAVHSHNQEGLANSGNTRGGINYEPSVSTDGFSDPENYI